MTKFLFNYKGKKFNINVKECRGIFSKGSGLMFRKKSPALLFIFKKKNREAIHSFFCIPFIAIWFDSKDVVDIKYIKNWKLHIQPTHQFDKFLEIPENDLNFNKIKLLIYK